MTDENEISTDPTDENETPDELDLETYDLDGLLEASSPLLARAFGGQERRRRNG